MEEGLYSKVLTRMEDLNNKVTARLGKNFVKNPPFDTQKITPKMQLDWFNQNFTPENEAYLRQALGNEAADNIISHMNKLLRGK